MKRRRPRVLLALLLVIVAVFATFAIRLGAGETPSIDWERVTGLVLAALLIFVGAGVSVLIVGYIVLSVVRAGTREFTRLHPAEVSIRVRSVFVAGRPLAMPFYRFVTADVEGIYLWSHARLSAPDGRFAASEIAVLERVGRDCVGAFGDDNNPIVQFEVVPTKAWAWRSVQGNALDDVIATLSRRLEG